MPSAMPPAAISRMATASTGAIATAPMDTAMMNAPTVMHASSAWRRIARGASATPSSEPPPQAAVSRP